MAGGWQLFNEHPTVALTLGEMVVAEGRAVSAQSYRLASLRWDLEACAHLPTPPGRLQLLCFWRQPVGTLWPSVLHRFLVSD